MSRSFVNVMSLNFVSHRTLSAHLPLYLAIFHERSHEFAFASPRPSTQKRHVRSFPLLNPDFSSSISLASLQVPPLGSAGSPLFARACALAASSQSRDPLSQLVLNRSQRSPFCLTLCFYVRNTLHGFSAVFAPQVANFGSTTQTTSSTLSSSFRHSNMSLGIGYSRRKPLVRQLLDPVLHPGSKCPVVLADSF